MGIFMVCTPHHIDGGDEMKKNEMDLACGMYGGEERCMWGFVGEMSEKGTIWKM
jgi:hypothetical protein